MIPTQATAASPSFSAGNMDWIILGLVLAGLGYAAFGVDGALIGGLLGIPLLFLAVSHGQGL
jgi:hypothetical protein